MKINGRRFISCHGLIVLASTLLIAACNGMSAPQVVSQNIYVLESGSAIQAANVKHDLVLSVSVPLALAGFDTFQMVYVQKPHELNYFAASRWADSPARMLGPLIVHALEQAGSFRAVVQASGTIPADIRLDTKLVRLLQDFKERPSKVQLTLRAQLIDVRNKRLLAIRQFDDFENTSSDDAYGGVTAANRLVQRLLGELVEFCVIASEHGLKNTENRP